MALPEAEVARIMEGALNHLSHYYGQSKRKPAQAMVARLAAATPPGTTITPSWVAPRNAHEKEDERHDPMDTPGLRRHYWLNTLRPLLTDATLLADMRQLTLTLQNMAISTEQRNVSMDLLQQCVRYFDLYFGLVTPEDAIEDEPSTISYE